MFANKTRVLLSFREDVLGRARVFPGLKLAEHQMLFANACRGASGSGEIRSGGGWRLGGVLAERLQRRGRVTVLRRRYQRRRSCWAGMRFSRSIHQLKRDGG